jgi:hypothetical protein
MTRAWKGAAEFSMESFTLSNLSGQSQAEMQANMILRHYSLKMLGADSLPIMAAPWSPSPQGCFKTLSALFSLWFVFKEIHLII